MSDNSTAHAAGDYERDVARTIPLHSAILDQAIEIAVAAIRTPRRWLDTGAGPGELVRRARGALPGTEFFLADPSPAMLEIARAKNPWLDEAHGFATMSEDLPDAAPFDVITAVQAHHYGDDAQRERSLVRCRDLLASPGVLVVFENVRAETEEGHRMQRARWAAWQAGQGRDAATIEKHLAREGTSFFPIRPSEHLALFRRLAFDGVELVFRNHAQAGFVAWKGTLEPG